MLETESGLTYVKMVDVQTVLAKREEYTEVKIADEESTFAETMGKKIEQDFGVHARSKVTIATIPAPVAKPVSVASKPASKPIEYKMTPTDLSTPEKVSQWINGKRKHTSAEVLTAVKRHVKDGLVKNRTVAEMEDAPDEMPGSGYARKPVVSDEAMIGMTKKPKVAAVAKPKYSKRITSAPDVPMGQELSKLFTDLIAVANENTIGSIFELSLVLCGEYPELNPITDIAARMVTNMRDKSKRKDRRVAV
jgi:hypothetical protein